jgi:hypothetical protein
MRASQISYSAGARLADGGSPASTQLHAGNPRQLEWGLDPSFCSHTKADGSQCGARPAKNTPLCMGHLRASKAD